MVMIAGVDEAGRGPLIGSVVAAAVILDPKQPIRGLRDSKTLSIKQREYLFNEIRCKALAWSVAEASHLEIDRLNILQATLLAMQRAIAQLPIIPDLVRIDGNRCPTLSIPCEAIIRGDALHAEISAASIVAKVTRDRQMQQLDAKFPHYGFACHNGYPTARHRAAIAAYGVLPQHRRTYRPIREAIAHAQQRCASCDRP